jgi:hypothetical protein
MNLHRTTLPSRSEYEAAFAAERAVEYPEVEAYEHIAGFAIDRERLEGAARILACPVKKNPPNWQHGRVLYAAMRRYFEQMGGLDYALCFDCGTAKGFSALIAKWALDDSDVMGCVHSVDVINPLDRVFRNSVQDCDGLNRLEDYLRPWPEAKDIQFYKMTGTDWLASDTERVNVAFIDGKHSTEAVAAEGRLLASRQDAGDLVVFDDVQIVPVLQGLHTLGKLYEFQFIALGKYANRAYAVGARR